MKYEYILRTENVQADHNMKIGSLALYNPCGGKIDVNQPSEYITVVRPHRCCHRCYDCTN